MVLLRKKLDGILSELFVRKKKFKTFFKINTRLNLSLGLGQLMTCESCLGLVLISRQDHGSYGSFALTTVTKAHCYFNSIRKSEDKSGNKFVPVYNNSFSKYSVSVQYKRPL